MRPLTCHESPHAAIRNRRRPGRERNWYAGEQRVPVSPDRSPLAEVGAGSFAALPPPGVRFVSDHPDQRRLTLTSSARANGLVSQPRPLPNVRNHGPTELSRRRSRVRVPSLPAAESTQAALLQVFAVCLVAAALLVNQFVNLSCYVVSLHVMKETKRAGVRHAPSHAKTPFSAFARRRSPVRSRHAP